MATIFLILFLTLGGIFICGAPSRQFYGKGKRIAKDEDFKYYTSLYVWIYTIVGGIFTLISLAGNYTFQYRMYTAIGERTSIPTFIVAFGVSFAYRKLAKILLAHGTIKAIEKNFRPQDRLHKFMDDAQHLHLELNPEFKSSIEETIELFWRSNYSLPLTDLEPSIKLRQKRHHKKKAAPKPSKALTVSDNIENLAQ